MNRFFRSALFPLVVIVLLVYLASQVLIPKKENRAKITYSELIQRAEAGDVNNVTFVPNRQQINAELAGGQKVKVNYPTAQSQIAVPGGPRRSRTSASTRRGSAPRPGGRCSRACFRSCS